MLSAKADAVQATMKENEELKAERDNLRQRLNEAEGLSTERQEALVTLEKELHLAGLYKDKHNFSKVLSREKNAALPPTSSDSSKQQEASASPTGVSTSAGQRPSATRSQTTPSPLCLGTAPAARVAHSRGPRTASRRRHEHGWRCPDIAGVRAQCALNATMWENGRRGHG